MGDKIDFVTEITIEIESKQIKLVLTYQEIWKYKNS